MRNTEYASRTV